MNKMIQLGKLKVTPEQVWNVSVKNEKVSLSEIARKKMKKSLNYLREKMSNHETIYGVNTGFGLLSHVKIKDSDLKKLQINLIRSHCVGTGDHLTIREIRSIMFLRAANLSIGYSGIRPEVVEKILEFLNKEIHPVIYAQGSVGASGDLAPLSHLALSLIGEGEVFYNGKIKKTGEVLKKLKIKPLVLGPKEGLALINGTQFMTGIGVLSLIEAEYLSEISDYSGAMSLEALRGTALAFDENIHLVRPHPGQIKVAEHLRAILNPKGKESEISKSHKDCGKVQDPYSLRCMPQVHGATRDALTFVRDVLTREINSVTDNPLVFPEEKKVLSGGNFHGQVVAMALDFLSIGIAELGSISEQRIEKLINPALSDLPPFLTNEGGMNSGFMIVQVAAASIVSENKTLCHPASIDSIPTSADKEDHVSMGAWASIKAQKVVKNIRRVLAMELLAASTGIEFHRPLKTSALLEEKIKMIRKKVSLIKEDRMFSKDIREIEELLYQQVL